MTTEKTYYKHLRDILVGNCVGFFGAPYGSEEAAEQAAYELTRTLYGSLSKAKKKEAMGGARGRIFSHLKGVTLLLPELEEYIATLAIDHKDKVKSYVESIIVQEKESGIIKAITKVLVIKNFKLPGSEFANNTTDDKVEQSTLNKIKGLWKEATNRDNFVDFKTILRRIPMLIGSTTTLAFLQAGGIFNRTPGLTMKHACVLGFLPLQHVKEIEVARSGKVLKFRATGSVFLAKQEGGGQDAIKITGKLYRGEISILLLLFGLYRLGDSKIQEVKLTNAMPYDPIAIRKRSENIMKLNMEKQKPSAENRRTFPFVSRHVIIPNVYIETLSFEERVDNGIDVIGYDILLRTFKKQTVAKTWNTDDPNTKFASTKYSESLFFHKMFEYSINSIWRIIQTENYVLNTGYWKVGTTKKGIVGKPQARDVYYNIEIGDIVGTFAMGIMGFASSAYASLATESTLNVAGAVVG